LVNYRGYAKKHISTQHETQGQDSRVPRANEHTGREEGSKAKASERAMEAHSGVGFSFTKRERLHLSRDFQNIFLNGRVYTTRALKIIISDRTRGACARLGLVVSRKLGDANVRNRLKRRLREIFRLNKHAFRIKADMLFIPRNAAVKLDYAQLREEVTGIWRRAKLI
jgi:ribonuclease P protein component